MRYHTNIDELYHTAVEATPEVILVHCCHDHPIFSHCTLYKIKDKGLAVVEQKFKPSDKATWWGAVREPLAIAIYNHPKFIGYFNEHARPADENGLYPTIPVRKVMWALRMKPLKKERWETVFDREEI